MNDKQDADSTEPATMPPNLAFVPASLVKLARIRVDEIERNARTGVAAHNTPALMLELQELDEWLQPYRTHNTVPELTAGGRIRVSPKVPYSVWRHGSSADRAFVFQAAIHENPSEDGLEGSRIRKLIVAHAKFFPASGWCRTAAAARFLEGVLKVRRPSDDLDAFLNDLVAEFR